MKLIKRIITGIILTFFLISALYLGNPYFSTGAFVFAVLIMKEILDIQKKSLFSIESLLSFSAIAFIFYLLTKSTYFWIWSTTMIKIITALFLLLFLLEVITKKYLFKNISILIFIKSLGTIIFTFPFLILTRGTENGILYCLFLFLIVSGTDIAAYIVGKYFGKYKMSSLSPKKTWEGAVAGLLGALLIAGCYSFYFSTDLLLTISFGLLLSVIGQFGDLHESLIKREYSVKDSSHILPGHGGIYDRSDSYLFAFPILFYFGSFFL
ncbi:phosphatidate cytidylyltransferase [Candidatus Marinamargulisbacteria bacterium SCGC AG-414-C22]|nr:phosphatidate cytidylyltransferase [Candidatus Marinamargulisbacteria bacterium SCGC AG-414-C22]